MNNDWEIPEMTSIPAMFFTMGDLWNEGEPDEHPVYEAFVPSFQLSRFAVTVRQYAMFLNDTGATRDEGGQLLADLKCRNSPYVSTPGSDKVSCRTGSENLPATYVSWFGAVAFCQWLSDRTGKHFRLPSEEEWQFAAMGPKQLKWSLGNEFDPDHYVCARKTPDPVNSGAASEFGLYNMTGNIFEWCADEYTFCFDGNKPDNVLNNSRTVKGGAFLFSDSLNFRNAKRFSCHETSCINCVGFRIASD